MIVGSVLAFYEGPKTPEIGSFSVEGLEPFHDLFWPSELGPTWNTGSGFSSLGF